MAALFVLFLVALFVSVQSFSSNGHRMTMSLKDYKEELAKTAAAIAAPGMELSHAYIQHSLFIIIILLSHR